MNFLPEPIQEYAEAHCPAEPEMLQQLYRQTHLQVAFPRMLSGHYQGRLLAWMSKLLRPKRILELGTYTGYSALCLAEGLAPGGQIDTVELYPELAAFAGEWFAKAGLQGSIVQHIGRAGDIVPTLQGPYDMVFIDADKEHYLDYYQLCLPLLRPGGVLITDNVLWSGKVVDKSCSDAETLAIRSFNTFVAGDPRVEAILLPVRDGLYWIQKKE